jgi:hypothetical protein
MKISIIKSSNIDDYRFRNLIYQNRDVIFFTTETNYCYFGEKELRLHYYRNKGAVPVKIKTYELLEVLGAFTIKSKVDRIIDNTGNILLEVNYLGQIKKSEIIINPGFWYGSSTYKYLGQIHELIYNSGKL